MCWNIYNFYGIEVIIIDLNVYCSTKIFIKKLRLSTNLNFVIMFIVLGEIK
jgi:hypothetical protein